MLARSPMDDPVPVVGRLAPSPTGRLHLGHARSFLLAWWHARSRGGRVVLRIDDLDGPRVRPEYVDGVLRDLEWLGLDWDGPPAFQSRHREAYLDALRRLEREGLVYACTCSRGEIRAAQSAPHADASETRYPATCRGRFADPEGAERATGRSPGLRLAVAPGDVAVHDELQGDLRFDVAAEVGDFLVARRDGTPAYQLAVVVDDALQGVTEVVRGEDLLPSTARQRLLQRALELAPPRWWHVPLVVDTSGQRLAKRTDALSLAALRQSGVGPRSIVAWAARTAGLTAPEPMGPRDALEPFSIARIPLAPVPTPTPDDLAPRPETADSLQADPPIADRP